jgi:hypothetical protein
VQEKVLNPSVHVPPFWQGLEAHSLIFVSQSIPENPGKQVQEKELNPSTQVALFWQGLEAHSLIFVWHTVPENPGKHEQRKVPPF